VPGEFGSRLNDPRNSCYNSGCLATDLAVRRLLSLTGVAIINKPCLLGPIGAPELSSTVDCRL